MKERLLQDTFGLRAFRAGQEKVIDGLLAGRSMLAVFPTGGGKSLCYQLPALVFDGLTLVVSPLIALMKDQVDGLCAKGISAARLDSSLPADKVREVYEAISSGQLKLLYIAPERLANERFREMIGNKKISLLAIDEAHCISEWGHNFRPDYLKLARLAKKIGAERVLALTATATPGVAAEICQNFSINDADHVQTGFRRPNLRYHALAASGEERDKLLAALAKANAGSLIVYVSLQKTAEAVAFLLKNEGISARAYHAGMPDEARARVQESFMMGETRVVVATIAFGMGIDKADIRGVIHYNLPKSLENYSQETGRAGRDGMPSECFLLADLEDLTVLENFVLGDTPSPQALRHFFDHVLRLGPEFSLSNYELSSVNDIRPLVVGTILAQLELQGIIEAKGAFFTTYKVKFLRPMSQIVAGYNERRKEFLQRLFGSGKSGRTWLTVDVDAAAEATGAERSKVLAALGFLEEAGDVEIQTAGSRMGYRLLRREVDIAALTKEFLQYFEDRESREMERLQTVVDFIESTDCLEQQLMRYFGESDPERCGQCSVCEGKEVSNLERRSQRREISEAEVATIQQVIAEKHSALGTERQLTRFLCGISSPAASRARLSRHQHFGCLEEVPFEVVREFLSSLGWK